ncbi:autophagy-related protein 27 [Gongronella butleri]|nr:autophagy-related protein 27 [Gongronella butleri]
MKLSVGAIASFFALGVAATQDYCNKGFQPRQDYVLDLSAMNKNFMTDKSIDTTPLKTIERVYANLCDPLKRPDGVDSRNFCADGSYVCRTTGYQTDNNEMIAVVDSLAGGDNTQLNAQFQVVSPDDYDLTTSGAEYRVTLHGGKALNQDQSVEFTLQCGTGESKENPNGPVLQSYENGLMKFTWRTVYFCATRAGDQPPPSNGPPQGEVENGGKSVIGWFFTLLGIGLLVYFVGGCFYNYRQFNARGLDLIPHRDFWLDLPYLIKDLVSHLMSSVMSRRHDGGGYVSV